MLPHEIRAADGTPHYKCRGCGATDNLRWFGGTSCPVCTRPDCVAAVAKEYQAALDEPSQEME